MSEIELVLRSLLVIVGTAMIIAGVTVLQLANSILSYSFVSSILEIFVGFGLIVLGLSKKPEKVFETIVDFLRDVVDKVTY